MWCHAAKYRKVGGLDKARIGCPGSQKVGEGCDTVVQIAYRITGTDRALACLAKEHVQRSLLEVRGIGKSDERSKVIPIVLVQPDTGGTADKLLRRKTLRLTARSRGGLEEISKSRYTEEIAVFRLDRQTVRNGRNT